MGQKNWILIFIIGFLCGLFSLVVFSRKVICQPVVPSSVSFSGESNVIYLLDRDNAKIYRYNIQGRLTRTYTINELGKDLQLR